LVGQGDVIEGRELHERVDDVPNETLLLLQRTSRVRGSTISVEERFPWKQGGVAQLAIDHRSVV